MLRILSITKYTHQSGYTKSKAQNNRNSKDKYLWKLNIEINNTTNACINLVTLGISEGHHLEDGHQTANFIIEKERKLIKKR